MRIIYKDILIGCLIIAVVIFISILLPCIGVLTIADYGSYASGVGNILLSVIAFFSFCVAYKGYTKEVKTDRRFRSEKLYNRYNDFITKILENYNYHKSHLNYLRPYYDEYGRLGIETVSGEDTLQKTNSIIMLFATTKTNIVGQT